MAFRCAKEKAQHSSSNSVPPAPSPLSEIMRMASIPLVLLILAAASSPVSQFGLSPVYGSIPASIYHQRLVVTTFLLAVVMQAFYRHHMLALVPAGLWCLPTLALASPIVQNLVTKRSALLGPSLGPLLTELCTYFPLLFLSVLSAIVGLCAALRIGNYGHMTRTAAAGVVSCTVFIGFQTISRNLIQENIGKSLLFTRFGLQYVIAASYVLLLRSRLLLPVCLLLLYPHSQNTHLPLSHRTAIVNQTLHSQGYSLVARQESLTGYISVLENLDQGFRAMRCDHSLLGGEWIDRHGSPRSELGEPIYSCFVMLEAVRLVVCNSCKNLLKPDWEKQALVM